LIFQFQSDSLTQLWRRHHTNAKFLNIQGESSMGKKLSLLAMALILSFASASAASADDYYFKGKTIRIVVGFSAGGGFDTYAGAIGRHMSKHSPGQPAKILCRSY
jgi:hypothetical protein